MRGSATERGYDLAWAAARNLYISVNPWCEPCWKAGDRTRATIVHHKIPIKDGGDRLAYTNLEAVCRSCHAKVEEHETGGAISG